MAQSEKAKKAANRVYPVDSTDALLPEFDRTASKMSENPPVWMTLEPEFQRLIQQLHIVPTDHTALSIGVCSAVRGEGRTTIARGLAETLVQTLPLPVVILETDLAHPTLAKSMGLAYAGLSEYVRGEVAFDLILQPTDIDGLMVVVAGDSAGKERDILRKERLTDLFALLSERCAVILVDMPPFSQVGESTRLISQVNQIVMVVAAGKTPKRLVQKALELIPGDKVAGIILNRTRLPFGFFSRFRRKR